MEGTGGGVGGREGKNFLKVNSYELTFGCPFCGVLVVLPKLKARVKFGGEFRMRCPKCYKEIKLTLYAEKNGKTKWNPSRR